MATGLAAQDRMPGRLPIMPHRVERMDYLQRLLDKIDRFELLIAGLVGALIGLEVTTTECSMRALKPGKLFICRA